MTVRRRTKALAALASLATAATGFAVVAGPAGAIPAGLDTQSWTTPGSYTWVVPAGVTSVEVVAEGGQGADGGPSYHGSGIGVGGLGGRETATVSVVPGSTLQINVAGAAIGESGGSNGGGSTHAGSLAGGGGGASDVRVGGSALSDRVVVAGGGGGGARRAPGGYAGAGGDGGGTAGTNGEDDLPFDTGGKGAGAGTSSAGGAGGASHMNGSAGTDGAFGVGGDVASACEEAGAGGGGWYGGGAGSSSCWMSGGGGGGGSNYAVSSATNVLSENGVNAGDGSVTLTWTIPPTTTITTTTTTAPPAAAPTTTAAPKPAPTYTCPTHAIRVDKNTFWAVNLLRWVCGYQISKIRNGKKVVTYVVPFGWKWKWTSNPARGR